MFIPLYDGHPLRRIARPWVNWSLIGVTVATWAVFQSGFVIDAFQASVISFGMIPAVLFEHASLPLGYEQVPSELTLVTSIFLHGDVLHLAGNMMFLWVFGDNLEDAMGHLRYLVFYLLCGAAAAGAHALAVPVSEAPLVGASGAIAGIVAGYLLLHPNVRIWILALGRIPLRLNAGWVIGIWLALQVFNLVGSGPEEEVSWWAHIGGFAAGLVLTPLMKAREVRLFDRPAAPG